MINDFINSISVVNSQVFTKLDPNNDTYKKCKKAYHDFGGDCKNCKEGRARIVQGTVEKDTGSKKLKCTCGKRGQYKKTSRV